MVANIHNENFGYSVACDGYWAAVGNPGILRYTPESASFSRTGSIEVYRYNINTDNHDLKAVIRRPWYSIEDVLLAVDSSSIGELIMHTELTGSVPVTSDFDLLVDLGLYYTASDDGYGRSIDIFNYMLVVGNPYFSSSANFITASIVNTGSGNVDFFDLTRLDVDPYVIRQQPEITGYIIGGSGLSIQVSVPSSQSFGFVLLETSESGSDYQKTDLVVTSNNGGTVILDTNYASTSSFLLFRVSGIVSTDPYVFTIENPNPSVSSSFGWDVSKNSDWLAVSSIYESGSKGAVFMYRKVEDNETSWSLYQTISPPAGIDANDYFGWSLDLNKATGSFSGSLIVGSSKISHSKAYLYELLDGNWTQTYTFYPDNSVIHPLTFYPTDPFFSASVDNTANSFGYDVAIYGNTVMIGAPKDRYIYEYLSSSLYHQGSVYFFERCDNPNKYYLARKYYGNEKILKDNAFGWSVSVFREYAVAGAPKFYMAPSICYLRGTLYQQHYCGNPDEAINGQFALFNKTTGSIVYDSTGIDWNLTNIYQIKKRLMEPHRAYGFSVDLTDNFIIVGAPMLISGSNRVMDLTPTIGSFTGSVDDIGDLSGKAYIYNLKNFRDEFYVGNVFYRNGKMVIMTSGSSFEGILQSDILGEEYQYDMNFKSKQIVFEKQVVCPIEPGEFNVSTNPSALTISQSSYDLNNSGRFDFQDVDVLLSYMKYKSSETNGIPTTDWSSSLISTATDEEKSVYDMYSSNWVGTAELFTQSFSTINNLLFLELDFNEDNKIDNNDMNILWKYFTYRLTQQNYETYITANSKKKFLSDIIDYLNARTMRGKYPQIHSNFMNYSELSKADPTGSYLAPYVTTIGLYAGTELAAVAKLGSPIKITPDFPINIVIKMDF